MRSVVVCLFASFRRGSAFVRAGRDDLFYSLAVVLQLLSIFLVIFLLVCVRMHEHSISLLLYAIAPKKNLFSALLGRRAANVWPESKMNHFEAAKKIPLIYIS